MGKGTSTPNPIIYNPNSTYTGGGMQREKIIKGITSSITQVASNLGSDNLFKGATARSLFYEGAKRKPDSYGLFLFYSFGMFENNFIDAYYKSESRQYNKKVSSLDSKNPSAGFLVRETHRLEAEGDSSVLNTNGLGGKFERSIIGGLSAPYSWKDFLYCKYYGSIPNNYMITLRRFPNPVLDNFSLPSSIKASAAYRDQGLGKPIAQAVTWMGGNTGNSIKSLTSFSTGLTWTQKTQKDSNIQQAFTRGAFFDKPFQWFEEIDKNAISGGKASKFLSGAMSNAAAIFDPTNSSIDDRRAYKLRERSMKEGIGNEYLWASVNTINKTYMRGIGLPFGWGGAGSGSQSLSVVFEYDLTSVGEVNTKAAMLDIMANLLSIGTNYGNFLTPTFRYDSDFPAVGFPGGDAGLEAFYRDPGKFFLEYGEAIINGFKTPGAPGSSNSGQSGQITQTLGNFGPLNSDEQQVYNAILAADQDKNVSEEGKTGAAYKKIKEAFKDGKGIEYANKFLRNAVTLDLLDKYYPPMAFFTGAPVGEWHLTIGNPCNPIAMIGNLICTNVAIEFGEILGPDDFPTTLKATFTLAHGRDRERGEIESIFNRGDGRLYQSTLTTSASLQSDTAVADTAGNNTLTKGLDGYINTSAYTNTYGPEIK